MKSNIRNLFFLPALLAVLNLIPAGRATAQTFTNLHSFAAGHASSSGWTNSGGADLRAGVILSGNTLYGTAANGGPPGRGTVFKVNTDGSGFTNLHNFTLTLPSGVLYINSDGASPSAGLILSGNTLYGTAVEGGTGGAGTVFAVKTNGTGFANLHSFTAGSHPGNNNNSDNTNSDGAYSFGGLNLSGNTLYGAAYRGGSSAAGTVFAVNTDGTGFTNLHSFSGGSGGAGPIGGLNLSGDTLYGTTLRGGSAGNGTVFKINTNGTGFTILHSFTATSGSPPYGNSDGATPSDGLALSGNTVYGVASGGGSAGVGTVFKLNTNGTGFTTLRSFTATSGAPDNTNSDGAYPTYGLVLSGNTLYGSASGGGSAGYGTVFAVNTDGTGFTNLHSFPANPYPSVYGTNSDGVWPHGPLILSGNTLYGTAEVGGTLGGGTVFSLTLPLPPQLTILRSAANVILTWPADATGYTLQTAPASTGTFTNLPGATSPYTNALTGAQHFFRLISN